MMASLPELRAALYDVLSTIEDLTVYTFTPGTNPNYPALLIQPATATFTTALARQSGQDVYEFDLVILMSGADLQVAQEALDDYLALRGPRSVRQRINESPKLGLLDDSRTTARIERMESYGITQSRDPETRDFGATLRLIVRTTE